MVLIISDSLDCQLNPRVKLNSTLFHGAQWSTKTLKRVLTCSYTRCSTQQQQQPQQRRRDAQCLFVRRMTATNIYSVRQHWRPCTASTHCFSRKKTNAQSRMFRTIQTYKWLVAMLRIHAVLSWPFYWLYLTCICRFLFRNHNVRSPLCVYQTHNSPKTNK